ncbi:GTP cyclohydrolase IV [Picrophilus oshimae]|uniref:GTP cyclohydrolase MptA n=1 Tax=Picrophilus torridus (strain ATCC 700027 / DSM 9790 / JCM 10055 / NBRC 100828 / KAW 2/3) TaxID=1122961 RepID=A0A8G2FXF9_PICTO|nr:GTP cyclohydrolase IV [Picrophilus oshimae]SMD31218.1 GTP cyclohydrolase I [Picrophilus oshimae DSM 9789]
MIELKDVQGFRPDYEIPIKRAGIKSFKRRVKLNYNNESFDSYVDVSISVSLNPDRKGLDMSRTIESVRSSYNLNDVAYDIYNDLFSRINYSSSGYVNLSFDFYYNNKIYPVSLIAEGDKNDVKRYVEVSAEGMTVCPCAMETIRSIMLYDYNVSYGDIGISHNQRNKASLKIQYIKDAHLERLIDILESSFSYPVRNMLKRYDEGKMIIEAHKRPKFVEDVVREIAYKAAFMEPEMNLYMDVRSESFESIHPHNAYAEIEDYTANIRSYLKNR